MLSRTASKAARAVSARRLFSVSSMHLGAGDTGSEYSRGGERLGDSFTRREKAIEDVYFRRHEQEKLVALREKIAAAKTHLNDLEKDILEITRLDKAEDANSSANKIHTP